MENVKSAMLLSAAGDAMGYKNGTWKLKQSGKEIMNELDELGGLGALVLYPDTWPVSDETLMHMATAKVLISHGKSKNKDDLYNTMATEFKATVEKIANLRPDPAYAEGCASLHPGNVFGWHIPFNKYGTGFGAATKSLCVGLVHWKPEHENKLIAIATECGRMTHNHPLGFTGSVCTALFTSYILQNKPVTCWGRDMLKSLEKMKAYCKKTIRHNEQYKVHWPYFETKWEMYLKDRNIFKDGDETARFPSNYDLDAREKVYRFWSSEGQPGRRGHDAPMIAYDAILAANQTTGNKWQEVCYRAMIHGGENDATGFIAGFWYGLMNGMEGVPIGHHEKLQHKDELVLLAEKLYELGHQEI